MFLINWTRKYILLSLSRNKYRPRCNQCFDVSVSNKTKREGSEVIIEIMDGVYSKNSPCLDCFYLYLSASSGFVKCKIIFRNFSFFSFTNSFWLLLSTPP